PVVMMAERVGEIGDLPAERVLEAAARLRQLAAALGVRDLGETGMGGGVRAADEALLLEGAGLVPVAEGQLRADPGDPPWTGGSVGSWGRGQGLGAPESRVTRENMARKPGAARRGAA